MNSLEVCMQTIPDRISPSGWQGTAPAKDHVCDEEFCSDYAPALYWLALYQLTRTFSWQEGGGGLYEAGELVTDSTLYTTGLLPQCFNRLCEAKAARASMNAYADQLNNCMHSSKTQYRAKIHQDRLPDRYSGSQPLDGIVAVSSRPPTYKGPN